MANRRRRLGVGFLMMGTAAWLVWPIAIATYRGTPLARRALRVVKRRHRPRARVLVVGDGPVVGAPAPHVSVAERLAEAHPEWSVGILAPGARRTADVARLLGRLARRIDRRTTDAVYDAVVIHTGGRDVLRFTSEGTLAVGLVEALAAANRVARHTVLAVGGDLVAARAFPPPWSWVFNWRGQWVRELFQAVAWEAGVAYVDRIRHSEVAQPTGDPQRSSARAGGPSSDDSYERWLDEIESLLRSWIDEDVDGAICDPRDTLSWHRAADPGHMRASLGWQHACSGPESGPSARHGGHPAGHITRRGRGRDAVSPHPP